MTNLQLKTYGNGWLRKQRATVTKTHVVFDTWFSYDGGVTEHHQNFVCCQIYTLPFTNRMTPRQQQDEIQIQ